MSNELTNIDTNTGEIIEAESTQELIVIRPPQIILDEATVVAKALKQRIDQKLKPVKFNGETYLEYEDWQLVAKFYGLTAKVLETKYVEYGEAKGFEARAVVFKIGSGEKISAAEAICLDDENNWKKKPLFQLKSMAQTRACAKALRNVLAWVVVLAGYKPTPAEEMISTIQQATQTVKVTPQVTPKIRQPLPLSDEFPVWNNDVSQNTTIAQPLSNAQLPSEEVCSFGKNKGVPWRSMTDSQLKWYKENYEKQMNDPKNDQYKDKNMVAYKAIFAELEAREQDTQEMR